MIRVLLKAKMAHFGTAFSNHTSKMTYRLPSKTSMRGFVGAALGISFDDCQELPYRFNFSWLNDVKTSMVAQSRMVLENTNSVQSVLGSKAWERGELKTSIDYIEYVVSEDGYLEGELLIEVLDGTEDQLIDSLLNPEYPLYFGSSESFVKVLDVEKLDLPKMVGESEFLGMFVGELSKFRVSERVPSKMSGYRKPVDFEDVYNLENTIVGKSKYGYYVIDGVSRSFY